MVIADFVSGARQYLRLHVLCMQSIAAGLARRTIAASIEQSQPAAHVADV